MLSSRKVRESARAILCRFPRLHALVGSAPLWRWTRRSVCRGMAIGVFFGVLIPVGQIPVAAVVASVCRANIPAALMSTLVTNPVTTLPLYYLAYEIGGLLNLGLAPSVAPGEHVVSIPFWKAGRALLIGVPVMASAGSVCTYVAANLAWVVWLRWKRKALFSRQRASVPQRTR
jgi:uncharacterized protein (DUF2062 family)